MKAAHKKGRGRRQQTDDENPENQEDHTDGIEVVGEPGIGTKEDIGADADENQEAAENEYQQQRKKRAVQRRGRSLLQVHSF